MQINKQEEGTTLVEVAIAMSTVAVLSIGVMLGFSTASSQDRMAYELQRSQNSCVAMIELVESFDYEELLDGAGDPVVWQPAGKWQYTVSITQIENDLLAISVTSQEIDTGNYSTTVATLITLKEAIL